MNTPAPTLATCLAEITAQDIPWAGDPGADFNTGLYAVLDHANDHASAVMYYRPQSHEFLMYVYVPSHDESAAAEVADAVARYIRRPGALCGTRADAGTLPGAVLWELDKLEAARRLATLRATLSCPAEDLGAFRVY